MGKKHRKPKTKMKSYGGGKELPIVKDKQGLFKKPEFYLADQKYDNLGHGTFEGQYTGKLEGPSQRAIRGKGKKAKNVRVHNEGGDPIFLQDTSPMKQKYSSQSGMESAVKRWKSPNKLTGDPNAGINQTLKTAKAIDDKVKKEKKEAEQKKAAINSNQYTKMANFLGSDEGKKKISEEKAKIPKTKQELKEEKKIAKKAYKESDEFKEKDASRRSKVNQIGKALMDFADLDTSNINIDSPKKEKKLSESAKDGEITIDDSHIKTPDKSKEGESSSIERRGDLKAMSAMMRKIKNPRKVEKEKISGSDFGTGSFTGTKKTITKGDKTIVKTKKKGDDGNWKKKTSEKTVGDEYGDGKVKYVDKSKYSRKASENNPKKKIKKTKVKEVYESGEKVKDTYKVKRVDGKNKRKATRKDGEWKAKKK